jgi:hypothetical protein
MGLNYLLQNKNEKRACKIERFNFPFFDVNYAEEVQTQSRYESTDRKIITLDNYN